MWLPKPVYESLPFVYVLVGCAVIGVGAAFAQRTWDSSASFVGGLAIVAVGVAVGMKRRSARLDQASRRTRQVELFDRSRAP
jgi:hypothetical protein